MEAAGQLRRMGAIAVGIFLVGSVHIHLPTGSSRLELSINSEAFARSSGGRSGGGSFSSPSRSSGSNRSSGSGGSYSGGGYSSPRRSYPSSNPDWEYRPYQQRGGSYYDRGPVIVPIPAGPPVYIPSGPPAYSNPDWRDQNRSDRNRSTVPAESATDWIAGLLILGVGAGVIFLLVFWGIRAARRTAGGTSGQELGNETVTVSKIQVALLAQARSIQAELTKLSLEVDTNDSGGLLQLLQESALALLRSPENWSHVLSSSETVKSLTEAEALFNRLSIAERSKFSVETLTNVGGKVSHKPFKPDPEEDPASYIVVTLLVGTAHDRPLFDEIRTTEALQTVLEKLAAMPSDYLMVFELLWSPQEETDSLTYDELLTEYSAMIQI